MLSSRFGRDRNVAGVHRVLGVRTVAGVHRVAGVREVGVVRAVGVELPRATGATVFTD